MNAKSQASGRARHANAMRRHARADNAQRGMGALLASPWGRTATLSVLLALVGHAGTARRVAGLP